MLSSQQLMNFSHSNDRFIEDNLLDSNDWTENGDLFDLIGYDNGSPSSSSFDSDQTSNTDYSPTSLNSDDIDTWLQDGLLQQQSSQLYDVSIKEEPPSPPTINPNEINNIPVVIHTVPSTTESTIDMTTTNIVTPKVPISRVVTQKAAASMNKISPAHYTVVNTSSTPKNGIVTSSIPSSNIVHLKNASPLPLKTEQLNTALLPREKYDIPPKIVKLENGQFYIARSVLKPPSTKQPGSNTNNQVGQKRQAPIPATASITKDYSDLKNLKRQQRMMKNRESACLSRQRKKVHLKTLEVRVTEITTINEQLKEENKQLRERITVLESENNLLKGKVSTNGGLKDHPKKSTTFVMAILFFVLFNPFKFFPMSPPPNNHHLNLKPKPSFYSYHRSRALLQFDNSNINYDPSSRNLFKTKPLKNVVHDLFNSLPQKDAFTLRRKLNKKNVQQLNKDLLLNNPEFQHQDTDCEETFNKTDLTRINKVLEGFVKGFGKENDKKKKIKPKNAKKFRKIIPKIFPHNCSETVERPVKPLMSPYFRSKPKKLPEKIPIPRNTSQELFNEIKQFIHRKPDTFYVVSMKDFLVLPATNYSLDHRLKFSFMLPAFIQSGNETSLKDNLSMLQIDCNVLDTKLVRLNRKNILSQLQFS